MTSDERRKDYLAAMGLVDWQYRDDGPLAGTATGPGERPPAVAEESGQSALADDESVAVTPEKPRHEPVADVDVASQVTEAAAPGDAPTGDQVCIQGEPVSAAESSADGAELGALDWRGLEAYLGRQDHRGASRPVFGIGARDADVLIVGEAPGANEDAQGVPFVGRAGKLLDRMLFAIGCSRDTNVYITNICKFRPPDNRDPTADEVAADWPILERQIDLMAPKLVVAVGRVAAQTLLDCQTPLGKLRGRLHRYPRRELDVLVTYHPAYLLRSPDQKNKAWADLKIIARHIGSWGT
ncbi:uracil-DNA glycosylase [Salinisphaera sp. SPP-AMP-43]|uniref:uracil-DNA glycosylase n=1 Tax=Salinisphaera sp. SPP-AMP-43 TaxID=3121288 RepID=UPI003C6DFF89